MDFIFIGCVVIATLVASYLLFCPPKVLVLFKADWCPHCKNFVPEWEKIKQRCQTRTIDASDPNCDAERFPTIRLYRGRHYIEYNGPRTIESIMEWYHKY